MPPAASDPTSPPRAAEREGSGRRRTFVRNVAVVAVAIAVIGGTLSYAMMEREPPARCAEGTAPSGARCCPTGQVSTNGTCTGVAKGCPSGLSSSADGHCELENARVEIAGGSVQIGPNDWESQGVVSTRTLTVKAFWLDLGEVTYARWQACSKAGQCRALRTSAEPGLPAVSISVHDAEAFCGFVGGRLPTEDEWIFAAVTPKGFRYPWGETGLVCRRAVFGLDAGPCARGGTSAELVGSRPDGKSQSGLLDLAGNVAELAFRDKERVVALGGSFRSSVAAELKGWASVGFDAPRDDAGVRCAYDTATPPAAGK